MTKKFDLRKRKENIYYFIFTIHYTLVVIKRILLVLLLLQIIFEH